MTQWPLGRIMGKGHSWWYACLREIKLHQETQVRSEAPPTDWKSSFTTQKARQARLYTGGLYSIITGCHCNTYLAFKKKNKGIGSGTSDINTWRSSLTSGRVYTCSVSQALYPSKVLEKSSWYREDTSSISTESMKTPSQEALPGDKHNVGVNDNGHHR